MDAAFEKELTEKVEIMRRLGVAEMDVSTGYVRHLVLGAAPPVVPEAPKDRPTDRPAPEPDEEPKPSPEAKKLAKQEKRLFGAGK